MRKPKTKAQKYLVVFKNPVTDAIDNRDVRVRTLSKRDFETMSEDPRAFEDLVCYIPIAYLKKKSVLKHLLYIKDNLL